MSLQFPNARLLIYDLISKQGLSISEAIAQSACAYDLVTAKTAKEIVRGLKSPAADTCECRAAAKNVLLKYFAAKSRRPAFPKVNVEEVWSAVEHSLESFTQGASCYQQQYAPYAQQHQCAKLAPALFDYLLQQINRYP